MRSVMVFWVYSASQYHTSTPLYEIAQHAQQRGYNDAPVDVLCIGGYQYIPPQDISTLASMGFYLHDFSAQFAGIAARYPRLRALYKNHFFECFLRWIAIQEFYGSTPWLGWDADIFFNERLSVLQEYYRGSTFTCSSTCFVASHDGAWVQAYQSHLQAFEDDPQAYLRQVYGRLVQLHMSDPSSFTTSFFGVKIAQSLSSFDTWLALWHSTPEEMFVDYLVRIGGLPQHLARDINDYIFVPQYFVLPTLAWVHPMGRGIDNCINISDGHQVDYRVSSGIHYVSGRRLAWLHYQGAVYRACAVHQLLSYYRAIPAVDTILRQCGATSGDLRIYDQMYCPPSLQQGVSLQSVFAVRTALQAAIASDSRGPALLTAHGDPFSERAMARKFCLADALGVALAHYQWGQGT